MFYLMEDIAVNARGKENQWISKLVFEICGSSPPSSRLFNMRIESHRVEAISLRGKQV